MEEADRARLHKWTCPNGHEWFTGDYRHHLTTEECFEDGRCSCGERIVTEPVCPPGCLGFMLTVVDLDE